MDLQVKIHFVWNLRCSGNVALSNFPQNSLGKFYLWLSKPGVLPLELRFCPASEISKSEFSQSSLPDRLSCNQWTQEFQPELPCECLRCCLRWSAFFAFQFELVSLTEFLMWRNAMLCLGFCCRPSHSPLTSLSPPWRMCPWRPFYTFKAPHKARMYRANWGQEWEVMIPPCRVFFNTTAPPTKHVYLGFPSAMFAAGWASPTSFSRWGENAQGGRGKYVSLALGSLLMSLGMEHTLKSEQDSCEDENDYTNRSCSAIVFKLQRKSWSPGSDWCQG